MQHSLILTDKIFFIIWLFISLEDIFFFSYTWILSVIAFAVIKHKYAFIASVLCVFWPDILIGAGDISFLIYYLYTGNIYLKMSILCIVSMCIQKNNKVPLITAMFLSEIIYKNI